MKMMKMKDAMRKISISKRKDTPMAFTLTRPDIINALITNKSPSPKRRAHTAYTLSPSTPLSPQYTRHGSFSFTDDSISKRKISYEEILSARKHSSTRRKSENVIDCLNLESKGAELSAIISENNKHNNNDPIPKSPNLKRQDDVIKKSSNHEKKNKQPKSVKSKRTRRSNVSYSLEPNKLLENAIKEGYDDLVKGLVTSGQININKLNINGYAPLHLAAFEDKGDMICILLAHGAFIDILDSTGFSPLEVAVSEGSFECAQILIENGADQTLVLDGHYDDMRKSRASSVDQLNRNS